MTALRYAVKIWWNGTLCCDAMTTGATARNIVYNAVSGDFIGDTARDAISRVPMGGDLQSMPIGTQWDDCVLDETGALHWIIIRTA